jgi:hypothetical protein
MAFFDHPEIDQFFPCFPILFNGKLYYRLGFTVNSPGERGGTPDWS